MVTLRGWVSSIEWEWEWEWEWKNNKRARLSGGIDRVKVWSERKSGRLDDTK